MRSPALAAQAELRDKGAVALQVGSLQVAEQATALADHLQQATAGVVVLAVVAQVLGELVDALGEQRDLDLGRAGVAAGAPVLADQLLLSCPWSGVIDEKGGPRGLDSRLKSSTDLSRLLDVPVHLRDQLLDAREAPLAAQPATKATRRFCP